MLSSRAPNILQDLYEETQPHAFASKTPGRHVLPSTAGLKSALRKENATRNAPQTTLARSKAPTNLKQAIEPQRLFKDVTSKDTVAKMLGKGLLDVTNKTPAPSKKLPSHAFKTPLPGASKGGSKLAPLLSGGPTVPSALEPPSSALRPSASRRSSRIPRSASRSFETPAPGPRGHWEVSDGDISVAALSEMSIKEMEEEDDDDEIEYMPPTAYVEPYHPPYEMPDYKELSKRIMAMAHLPMFGDDDPLDESMFDVDLDDLAKSLEKADIPLRELEDDDPFALQRGDPVPSLVKATAGSRIAGSVASRPLTARPKVAPITPGVRTSRVAPSKTHARAAVPPPRPGSTTSTIRLPATKAPRTPLTLSGPPSGGPIKRLQPGKSIEKLQAKLPSETLDVFLALAELPIDVEFAFDV